MTSLVTNVVRGSDADRLLLLVHGYGADERDLGGLLPYLDPEGQFCVGAAPRPRGGGRHARASPGTRGARRASSTRRRSRPRSTPSTTSSTRPCEEQGFDRSAGARRRLLAGRRDDARPGAAAQRPAPADRRARHEPGAPRPRRVRRRLGGRAQEIPVLDPARRPGPARARRAAPASSPAALEGQRRARRLLRVPDGPPGRAREHPSTRRSWIDGVIAGEKPSGPVPDDPPEGPVKAVTTATFPTEVLQSDAAGDRRLLGAVVRTVPPGRVRSSSRSRRCATGRLQGREGQHRRRARARAGVRGAEHPADRAVPERPAGASVTRRQAAPAARSRARDARHPVAAGLRGVDRVGARRAPAAPPDGERHRSRGRRDAAASTANDECRCRCRGASGRRWRRRGPGPAAAPRLVVGGVADLGGPVVVHERRDQAAGDRRARERGRGGGGRRRARRGGADVEVDGVSAASTGGSMGRSGVGSATRRCRCGTARRGLVGGARRGGGEGERQPEEGAAEQRRRPGCRARRSGCTVGHSSPPSRARRGAGAVGHGRRTVKRG